MPPVRACICMRERAWSYSDVRLCATFSFGAQPTVFDATIANHAGTLPRCDSPAAAIELKRLRRRRSLLCPKLKDISRTWLALQIHNIETALRPAV
jgi:hypothetical protein